MRYSQCGMISLALCAWKKKHNWSPPKHRWNGREGGPKSVSECLRNSHWGWRECCICKQKCTLALAILNVNQLMRFKYMVGACVRLIRSTQNPMDFEIHKTRRQGSHGNEHQCGVDERQGLPHGSAANHDDQRVEGRNEGWILVNTTSKLPEICKWLLPYSEESQRILLNNNIYF